MSAEPKSVSSMTDVEFADFVEQMRLSVAEECHLWDLPKGSRDLIGDDEWRVHGPWQRQDCAAAIRLWLEAGLVYLYRVWPEEVPLDGEASQMAVNEPTTWIQRQDGSQLAVAATERGEDLAWEAWTAMLAASFDR